MVPEKVLCNVALVSFILAINPVWFRGFVVIDDVISDVTGTAAAVVVTATFADEVSDPLADWGEDARGDQTSCGQCYKTFNGRNLQIFVIS